MKKLFVVLGISLALAACGGSKPGEADGGEDSASATNQSAVAQQSNAANDTATSDVGTTKAPGTPSEKGAQLMANSDCNTCHSAQSKIIGPALVDIAKKYTSADVDKLAKKVIDGGSGNWGTTPMTSHPQLSMEDAKEMVSYILTVK